MERGQTFQNFSDDIDAAVTIHGRNNCVVDSIVFPRNQYSEEHLDVLKTKGIRTYRGNESHWMYRPRSREKESKARKLSRLIDAYINLSGYNSHEVTCGDIVNIPSSRFLRPYDPRFKVFENVRLKRIKTEMLYAAKNNKVFHLWWHPHNFGKYMEENFSFLRQILDYFELLKSEYNFGSLNMREIGEYVCRTKG